MIRINTDKVLLFILILCCVLSGILFEGLFFVVLILLVCRNWKIIVSNNQYKWFVAVVALYILLLLINGLYFRKVEGWRPVGITKVLCGISLCILISDRLCKNWIDGIFIKYLIVFNLLYTIFGEASHSGIRLFALFEYPGQNTLGCLNVIILPHVINTYKGKMKRLRIVYLLSFLVLFMKNLGFTLIFSVGIIVVWKLMDFVQNNTRLQRVHFARRIYNLIIPIVLTLMILLFFVNSSVQNFYLELLLKMDKDRYTILSQAIYRITNAVPQELIWGRVDNNYYMLSGRYVAAHNFIVEVITFAGLAGFMVLVLETFIFMRFIFGKIARTDAKRTCIISIGLGYLFFLLHPVYTTSFLVKIFLVLINLRACYISANERSRPKGIYVI